MPSQAVACPNCGSGEARRTSAGLFVCHHCTSNFQWNDKTKTAVLLSPNVCACGNTSVVFCYRCQQPLCHGCNTALFHSSDGDVGRDMIHWLTSSARLDDPGWAWARELLEKARVPLQQEDIRLCANCLEECAEVGRAVFPSHEELAMQGKVCGVVRGRQRLCPSLSVHGRCDICRKGFCLEHGTMCQGCHQWFCEECGLGCGMEGSFRRFCTKCKSSWSPRMLLSRFFDVPS